MLKRAMDICIASLLLIVMSVPMLITALLVRRSMGAPVLFRQIRPGLKGRPFELLKFRTMTNETDENGNLLEDRARLTTAGRWIRSFSLDELPQLWNVIRGDMSLVGPRPLLMEYLHLYSPDQARRHEVKPGITGWTQVNGRNALTWEEKFALDVWYVDNRSFWLDVRIIALTLLEIVRPRGISQPGSETMPKFRGSARHE